MFQEWTRERRWIALWSRIRNAKEIESEERQTGKGSIRAGWYSGPFETGRFPDVLQAGTRMDNTSGPSPGGETGRRKGLKIPFSVRRVWVQVPPRAPFIGGDRAGIALRSDTRDGETGARLSTPRNLPMFRQARVHVAEKHQRGGGRPRTLICGASIFKELIGGNGFASRTAEEAR